ncbi:MAG: DNA gyrase inhibitor YacG [Nevskiaceae bacterium]
MTARSPARCPSCHGPVDPGPGNPWCPFCSERCKLADLGQWFAERYSIAEGEDADATRNPPTDSPPRQ